VQIETRQALSPVIRLLSDPPDLDVLADREQWSLIKRHSRHLGVAAIAAYTARSHVTRPERDWCDEVLTRSWTRHLASLNHLQYVLGVLNNARIETIALKGPLLALRCYDPPFLRKSSGDLDIAVRQKDLQHACETLGRAGYTRSVSSQESLACSHHVVLTHSARPPIELHFRLSHGPLGMPVDEFFERSMAFEAPGVRTRVLGPADELLQLVLHLAHDRFRPIFHLYELRKIWRAAPAPVRQAVLSRAADLHLHGVIELTDTAFRARWGEPFLPAGSQRVGTWLHRSFDEKLYAAFESWSGPGEDLTVGGRIRGRWLQFQLTDRPADALRLASLMARIAWFQIRQGGWRTIKRKVPEPPLRSGVSEARARDHNPSVTVGARNRPL
jgi:hypothetical protein